MNTVSRAPKQGGIWSTSVRVYAGAAAAALLLSACGDGGNDDNGELGAGVVDDPSELTIGVANLGESQPFPASIGDGIEAAAEELGVEIVAFDGQGDAGKQSNDVQDLIAQDVDGVLLLPVDSGVAVGLVDQLVDAGIPTVAVSSQVGDPTERDLDDVYEQLVALVTQDEIAAGAEVGNAVVELLPDGGEIAIVEGQAGFAEVTQRAVGFEEVLEEHGGVEIVARQPGDWQPEVAESTCQNILSANSDIDLIYAQADDMATGCTQAVQSAGADTMVVGIGGMELAIDALREGTMEATVCYKPIDMGELALETMVDHLTGEETHDAAFITYDTPPVFPDNVDDCDPQW